MGLRVPDDLVVVNASTGASPHPAVVGFSFDFEDLGQRSGELLDKLLNGEVE